MLLRLSTEPTNPVSCSGRMGQARFLNVQKHRIEWSKTSQFRDKFDKFGEAFARRVEFGLGDELLNECAIGVQCGAGWSGVG